MTQGKEETILKEKKHAHRIHHYVFALTVLWTVVAAVSLGWNLFNVKQYALTEARSQARSIYNKDIFYRRWNAGHGGVYVPVTDKTRPNPYLSHIPKRDVTTESGELLTLINPTYMTRQVHELMDEQEFGMRGQITSLNPLNPVNRSDLWEIKALKAFEKGETEISSIEKMEDGSTYMRLMRPMITEESCLKCHAEQGYKVGDIRGGVSVSIPMASSIAILYKERIAIIVGHGVLWLLGLAVITLGGRKQNRVEESLSKEADRTQLLLELYLKAPQLTDKDLYEYVLEKTVNLTDSEIGFFHQVADDQNAIILTTWNSEALKNCTANYDIHYSIDKAGNWVDCVRFKQPVIYNDFPKSPNQQGLPDGHTPLKRFMSIPVMDGEEVRFIIGVGNKPRDYDKHDLVQLQLVANEMHKIIVHRRAEEELTKYRNSLEEQVGRRTSELKAINKELEAFSYSVSHDLRSPLRSIDGFSRAVMEDYSDKLDARGKDYLNRVRLASQRMGQLIDDMLSLSRITRSEMHYETVNLSALADEIAEELKKSRPERMAEFVVEKGMVARGDKRMLKIAMENLLNNAWKFTEKHNSAKIEFGAVNKEGATCFFVKDDGAGFDKRYINKLFGPFQRLHTSNEFPGTGIGLATVKRIIKRHGGDVWAEGAVEQGATFYFAI